MTPPSRDERRWTLYRELGVSTRIRGPLLIHSTDRIVVMPVSEHEAALAAARQVDEAAKRRAVDGMLAKSDDAAPSMKVVARAMWSKAIDTYDRERAALLTVRTVPEPEER